MSFLRQTGITLVARFALVVISFIFNILLSQKLGTAGMDIIAPLQTFTVIAVTIGYLGLERGGIYFIGLDKNRASAIAGTLLTVGLIASVIVYAGLMATVRLFPSILGGIELSLYQIQLLSITPLIISLFMQNLLLVHQKIVAYNVIEISVRLGNLIAALLIFLFVDSSWWIPAIVWLYLASSITIGGLNCAFGWKTEPFKLMFDWESFADMIKYSWKNYYSALMTFMIIRSDILFLNAYRVETDEAGIYSRVVYISDFFFMIPMTLGMLLFPKLMQEGASEESGLDERGRFTMLLARLVVFTLFILWIVFAIFGKWFLWIFGEGFMVGYGPMVILLGGLILIGTHAILKVELFRRGLPVFIVIYTTIGMIIKLTGNVLFIPEYGMYGAAWSSLATHAIFFSMALWYCVKHYGFKITDTLFIRKEDFKLLWERVKTIREKR